MPNCKAIELVTELVDNNCGVGSGGFESGNKCAGGGGSGKGGKGTAKKAPVKLNKSNIRGDTEIKGGSRTQATNTKKGTEYVMGIGDNSTLNGKSIPPNSDGSGSGKIRVTMISHKYDSAVGAHVFQTDKGELIGSKTAYLPANPSKAKATKASTPKTSDGKEDLAVFKPGRKFTVAEAEAIAKKAKVKMPEITDQPSPPHRGPNKHVVKINGELYTNNLSPSEIPWAKRAALKQWARQIQNGTYKQPKPD